MLVGYLWCSLDSLLHVTTVSELVLTSSFQYNLLTLFLLIVALPSIVGKLTQTKETVPTKEDILQHQIRNQKERLNIPEDLPTLEKRFITKIKEKVAHHGVVNVKEEFPHVSNASLNEVMMKLRVNARFEVPNDAYYVYTPDFKQDLLQRIKLLLKHNIKNTADMAQILGIGTDTVTYFMQQSNIHF